MVAERQLLRRRLRWIVVGYANRGVNMPLKPVMLEQLAVSRRIVEDGREVVPRLSNGSEGLTRIGVEELTTL